ncbi:MAG: twin-arginine translocase subunit TatC [Actinomycetota bacterium]|nr:twin-arginine translocase subunit TatC [Actinomycetota bacterium]
MAPKLRPVGYEDRLSLVDHLDELRKRLIVCVIVFGMAFAVCFWQNDALLDFMEKPFEDARSEISGDSGDPSEALATLQGKQRKAWEALAAAARAQASEDGKASAEVRRLLTDAAAALQSAADATPQEVAQQPITLGVGEPFVVTLRVATYGALLFSLPVILFQLYAFVLPAFSKRERQVALPLMLAIPLLFIAGAVFAYLLVLPRAISFLQNFNDDQFNIQLQAGDYFRFAILLMVVMGMLFQIPVGILASTRMGIVSVAQLRRHRRYAILVVAVLAMLLPGTDPITMLMAMLPLVLLYEGSILFASLLDRRSEAERQREAEEEALARQRKQEEADAEAHRQAEADLEAMANADAYADADAGHPLPIAHSDPDEAR